ncbi:MAG: DUF6603 domain-containing protein [Chryseolinea sp.]
MADNIIQKLTAGAGEVISLLAELKNDLSEIKAFINLLGWDLPPGLSDVGLAALDVENFITKLEAVINAPEDVWENEVAMISRIKELAIEINNIVQEIHTLADQLPTKLVGFPDYVNRTNIHKELPRRLFDFLVINYVAKVSPLSYAVLSLADIIDYPHYPADPANFQIEHVRATINYQHFKTILSDPGKLAKEAYGWSTPDFDATLLIQRLQLLFQVLGMRSRLQPLNKAAEGVLVSDAITGPVPMPQLLTFLFEERGTIAGLRVGLSIFGARPTSAGGSDGGIGIVPVLKGQASGSIALSRFPDTFIDFLGDVALLKGTALILRPDKELSVKMANGLAEQVSGRLALGWRFGYTDGEEKTLISFPGGAKLMYKSMAINGGVDNVPSKPGRSFLEINLTGCRLVLDLSDGDSFLTKSISANKIEAGVDLKIGWDTARGIYLEGSGGLEVTLPSNANIGPYRLDGITLKIDTGDSDLSIEASASGTVKLGPITAVINRMGLKVGLTFGSGNLGFIGLNPSFKSPSGIGLYVDAGGIKGGGILNFDPDNKEYFGGLELEFKNLFSLKAFGIINTRMPDGSDGYSMLIIVTAEFTPVQLGFGFTLNGVGGLLGVNRTTRVDALKEGVKTNAIESILFPQNIVANINRIVSDIKQIFPSQADHFLICPMGKIGWGTPTIITLELGILVEIPATGFKILGVLKALLPEESNPLLRLQVNFLGIIDFENRSISFDASLYDSRILTFTLTGDMALRLSFGDNPVFILSVGGFHPAFKEVPADLKSMRRITLSLYDGANARIIIQTYFAITSNTAQFGAKAELYAGSEGGFNIYGFVNYDVLFQFSPFKFIADLGAGVALRHGSSVIMCIQVSGELSGPTPWDASGKASVSFFFFSVSIPFHVTWGDTDAESGDDSADVLQLLAGEINDNRNWRAEIPANNKLHVSIKQIDLTGDLVAIHPFGILTFSQRLVPLELNIDKFGTRLPKAENRFSINSGDDTFTSETVQEQFAAANFIKMSDEQKLSRPSFEKMTSGFKITGSSQVVAPAGVAVKTVDYEFSYLGKKKSPGVIKYRYPGSMFKAHSKSSAVSQSSLSHFNNRVSLNAPEKVEVEEEQYVVANVADMKLYSAEIKSGNYSETIAQINLLINSKPELKGRLQVLSKYELNFN